MDKDTRLKLAVQKSGRLTDPSLDLLSRCGLKLSRGKDQLMALARTCRWMCCSCAMMTSPTWCRRMSGDLGLVGLNVLEEKRLELNARGQPALFQTVRNLDFGRCRLSLAVPDGTQFTGPAWLQGRRIATTYPYMLGRFLKQHDLTAEIVVLSGAVEIAPRLGRADAVCDLVSTGLDPAGQSPARSVDRAGKPRSPDPHAPAPGAGQG